MRSATRSRRPFAIAAWVIEAESEPYRQYWMSLTPAQRLLRSWRMRRRLKDPQAAHDARSLPSL
jgi:hypothetical protein